MDREDLVVARQAFEQKCKRVENLHDERSLEIDREYDDMLEDRRRLAEELADLEAEREALSQKTNLERVASRCLRKGETQLTILVRLACILTAIFAGMFAIAIDRLYFDGAAVTSIADLGWRVAERLADNESPEHDMQILET